MTYLSMTWVWGQEWYESDLSEYDLSMMLGAVLIWPIWVWLEYEGCGGDVEHDLPAHKGLPGEPDHGPVRAVSQQVAVELPVTLNNAYALKKIGK
jgi:hypothetical protein